MSSVFDVKFLAHVGIELIVTAGLTIWVSKKFGNVSEQIDNLHNKLLKCEELIERQSQMLMGHEKALRMIFNQAPPPAPVPQQENKPQHQEFPMKKNNSASNGVAAKQFQEDIQHPGFQAKESEETNVDNNQLDSLLSEELGQIEKSRENKPVVEKKRGLKKDRIKKENVDNQT